MNFIIDLNKEKTLDKFPPIIDSIQLYTNNIPMSWLVAIELTDNKLDFGVPYEFEVKNNLYIFKCLNGLRLVINKETQVGKMFIPSGAIPLLDLNNSIFQIRRMILKIRPKHNIYRNVDNEDFITSIKLIDKYKTNLMQDTLSARDWLISRLDLCINIKNDINLDKLKWFTKKETTIQKYYVTQDKKKVVSGVSVGKRGISNMFVRFYKKWLDPNKRNTYLKYYDTEFYRLEYELRRTQLKRIENEEYRNNKHGKLICNHNFSALCDLYKSNVLNTWKWALQTRHPVFKDMEKIKEPIKLLKNIKSDAVDQKRYDMIRGLLKPYRLEHNNLYNDIIEKIDKIFDKRFIRLKKSDVDLLNSVGISK